MISALRRLLAVTLAALLTVLSLGRLRPNRSGDPPAADPVSGERRGSATTTLRDDDA